MQVIRNARVYDGLGGEPCLCDVVLEKERIHAVLPAGTAETGEITDASGLSLAPGFIDVHAHSDLTLLAAPEAFGKISQGITTEISGNCGQSFFPVTDLNREALRKQAVRYGVELEWQDFASYRKTLEKVRPAVNFSCLSGHSTLRAAVLGYENIPASPEVMETMRKYLADAFRNGCPGISTGLIYVPGKFAAKEELEQLFSVLKEYDALYATHIRSEGDGLTEALEEAVSLAQSGSGRLQVSHLKTALPRNWHKLPEVFRIIESARKKGLRVTADRYPYTYSQTSLSVILPEPYDGMTDSVIQDVLSASPEECARCQAVLEKKDLSHVILSFTSLPEYKSLLGLHTPDAAGKVKMSPAAFLMDVLKRDAARAQGAFGGMSEENMTQILGKPWVCCGTDETARPADESLGRSHPRGFGSMPEFLNRVKEPASLAGAIRKVTSLPAEIFRLKDRGVIAPGMYADLVLFDETELAAVSDFARPHAAAKGIRRVWVNGVCAYEPGGKIRRNGMFAECYGKSL